MYLPKAELHVHLEGTTKPSLLRKLAKRNQLILPEKIFGPDDTYQWKNFQDFLHVYDVSTQAIKTPEDYYDITYDYLRSCAEENVIYVELTSSPNHAELNGLCYQDHLLGISKAIEQAKNDFSIEARILIVCVRHFGIEKANRLAELVACHPHPLVVGLNLAGDETRFSAKDFSQAFTIAMEAGLQCTAHAGEVKGAESIWETIKHLPVSRVGHGITAIDDPTLIAEIIQRNITLEICPTSNVALGVSQNFQNHPATFLHAQGVNITLNSDDPPYFDTTIGKEYTIAEKYFGFDHATLLNVTENAIKASFADKALKRALLNLIL